MKIATQFAIAMTLTSLVMVGCTCSKQENSDQVVPMEEPAAPADGTTAPSEEAAPADPGMAPAPEGTQEAPAQ